MIASKLRWGGYAVAGLLVLTYPLLVQGSAFYSRMGALVMLSAISASAWNIVGGYAGQVSVGHSLVFGAGAYTSLVAFKLWGIPPLFAAPGGIVVAVLLSIVIGLPTLRLKGHYFSMATIAVAELVRILCSNWDLVGAAVGVSGPASPRGWYDFTFTSSAPYYYLFLGILAVLLGLTAWIQHSRMGYYLRAINSSERAARSLGVPVARYKLYAYMLSAAFTAVAGTLYATLIGFMDPESGFGIIISVEMIIVAALGGAGTLFGPFIGALILLPLQNFSNTLFGASGTGLTFLVYGGIIILIARFEPGGL
ncbi:MAG TPA: branched-chain amino acid ABC transporter permease, partial [bacterium]